MNYQKIYVQLIRNRQINQIPESYKYAENHHIIPRCLNGVDDQWNIVRLSFREHYIAHLLLWKMYKEQDIGLKLAYAVKAMNITPKSSLRFHKSNSPLFHKFNSHLFDKVKQYSYNKRSKKYELNGKLYTINELHEISGIKKETLRLRLNHCHWTVEQAIKPKKLIMISYNGQTKTIKEWSKELGIKECTIWNKIRNKKLPFESLFKTPYRLFEYKGNMYKISDVAKMAGIKYDRAKHLLIRCNLSIDDILNGRTKERKLDYGNTTMYEYNGEKHSLRYYAKKFNMSYNTLWQRLYIYGYTIKEALETKKSH